MDGSLFVHKFILKKYWKKNWIIVVVVKVILRELDHKKIHIAYSFLLMHLRKNFKKKMKNFFSFNKKKDFFYFQIFLKKVN